MQKLLFRTLLLVPVCCFSLQQVCAFQVNLTVSEFNYNTEPTHNSGDWIELHNFGTQSINIGGYKVRRSNGTAYTIPANTNIAAGAYLVLAENLTEFNSQFSNVSNKIGPTGLSLSNGSDTLQVLNGSGTVLFSFGYDDAGSWPQCADGFGRTLVNTAPETGGNKLAPANWTEGCMFGSPGSAGSPCTQTVAFNEINYKSPLSPDAGDWVELYNHTSQSINLSGWQFRDSKDSFIYTIPNNTTLPASGYLVIYSDAAKFNQVFPNISNKVGPFGFALSSDGEVIRLYNSSQVMQIAMFYNDADAWPQEPDGLGPTLELRNPDLDINVGNNWKASCFNGTPGQPNSDCNTDTWSPAQTYDIILAPNPVDDLLQVTTDGLYPKKWSMYHISGQLILTQTVDAAQFQVDCGRLLPGQYILAIEGKTTTAVRKIIVKN